MQKLYLDCDGVILNTINTSYRILKEKGIKDEDEVRKFYFNLDWYNLIIKSGEINDSIVKIKELLSLYDISILTHVNSDNEVAAKKKYFDEVLPGVEVITVKKRIAKADYVNPQGAILVDDFTPNLDYWNQKGGISIKFSDNGNSSKYPTISDLSELANIKMKTKLKI